MRDGNSDLRRASWWPQGTSPQIRVICTSMSQESRYCRCNSDQCREQQNLQPRRFRVITPIADLILVVLVVAKIPAARLERLGGIVDQIEAQGERVRRCCASARVAPMLSPVFSPSVLAIGSAARTGSGASSASAKAVIRSCWVLGANITVPAWVILIARFYRRDLQQYQEATLDPIAQHGAEWDYYHPNPHRHETNHLREAQHSPSSDQFLQLVTGARTSAGVGS